MTVTALRLEPGLEVEGEGGVQVKVLHVDAQLKKKQVVSSRTRLELANVKLNCKYLISSIWPKPMQELVEKYLKLGPVLFYIL